MSVLNVLHVLKKLIIVPVPPEIDVCESCRQPTCNQVEWEACNARKNGEPKQ